MSVVDKTTEETKFLFFCPGCQCAHYFDTKIWTWNGDLNKPTVRASILTKWNTGWAEGFVGKDVVCHSFVTDGKIQFLPDSTHSLSGQIVDLVDWDSLNLPTLDEKALYQGEIK